jgi:preprotein translocase subunit SecY
MFSFVFVLLCYAQLGKRRIPIRKVSLQTAETVTATSEDSVSAPTHVARTTSTAATTT